MKLDAFAFCCLRIAVKTGVIFHKTVPIILLLFRAGGERSAAHRHTQYRRSANCTLMFLMIVRLNAPPKFLANVVVGPCERIARISNENKISYGYRNAVAELRPIVT